MLAGVEKADRVDALAALRTYILTGKYNPGDRLPSERELIVNLGMTRTRLRKALETLEEEGMIWRHVGKGTFLAGSGTDQLDDITRKVTPLQMMRARFALEPTLAQEAALNASSEALARVGKFRDQAMAAESWAEYEACDDLFHRSVAEATGNVLLLSLFDRLNQVRRAVAWNTVVRDTDRPSASHPSFSEHDCITRAIEKRHPATAHSAMWDHLNSVSTRLFGDV